MKILCDKKILLILEHLQVLERIVQSFFVSSVKLRCASCVFIHQPLEALLHFQRSDAVEFRPVKQWSEHPGFFSVHLLVVRSRWRACFHVLDGSTSGQFAFSGASAHELVRIPPCGFPSSEKPRDSRHAIDIYPITALRMSSNDVRIASIDLDRIFGDILASACEK